MNKIFTNPLFTFHNCILMKARPSGFAKDAFLRKKISDYYFSRLLPDFYYESKLGWNYSPYVVSSRILYTTLGFMTIYYFVFYRNIKSEVNNSKKYNFNVFTGPYLRYERALLESEKNNSKKMIC